MGTGGAGSCVGRPSAGAGFPCVCGPPGGTGLAVVGEHRPVGVAVLGSERIAPAACGAPHTASDGEEVLGVGVAGELVRVHFDPQAGFLRNVEHAVLVELPGTCSDVVDVG